MVEIVLNKASNFFRLSHRAMLRYAELCCIDLQWTRNSFSDIIYFDTIIDDKNIIRMKDIQRDHPALVQVVYEMGYQASYHKSPIVIEKVENSSNWYIVDHHGYESIMIKETVIAKSRTINGSYMSENVKVRWL